MRGNKRINLKDYENMFNEQEGKCAICKRHQSEFKKRLVVDHNHKTGKIRGLLCSPCNRMLGQVGDSFTILRNAIEYLKSEF